MVVRLNRLAIAAIAVTMPLVIAQRAIAQEVEVRIRTVSPGYVETIPEAVDDAFFSHDVEFYGNRSFGEQLDWIFGIGGHDFGYLENEIWRDGEAISDLTETLLFEQAHSTPIIRTADLPNPFEASLQTIERIEPLEPVPLPPARPPIITTPPTARPPAAVPALW